MRKVVRAYVLAAINKTVNVNKVITIKMALKNRLFGVSCFLCASQSIAGNDPVTQTAMHVNGESLVYIALLAGIAYLFFRKPFP